MLKKLSITTLKKLNKRVVIERIFLKKEENTLNGIKLYF
tara:strand:- start:543 stop:659 length:117 start_codon:yes stop_codon:yes gene_type:complete